MNNNQKALLLGDITNAKYHPLQAVADDITDVFQDHIDVEISEDREKLTVEQLKAFDLFISYTDSWKIQVTPEQVAGVLAYVSGGGGLLVIHNGVSLQARYELSQLIGAKFTGHPPYTSLDFHLTSAEHEITQGIESFCMDEEPYRYDMDPLSEKTVLLEYTHEGKKWPAAWAHEYGLGRVVYLMPGHHVESFKHPTYRKLILQAGQWALRKQP
ncbi:ThuA domain-containing protein [Paenibacillus sp. HWE-109]|uniref:ThuA domain-containing protein n=1 Tax=Paenibacillus sp. HWE-109 TaxID=1306526 RepID=UPI001EDDDBDB|nr:ThuA domain-containing protein [Paenibacillus sp. HWE-109]UKS25487.1 ThuA domain-containing protein [Paenibacillus sp. HWE-109]